MVRRRRPRADPFHGHWVNHRLDVRRSGLGRLPGGTAALSTQGRPRRIGHVFVALDGLYGVFAAVQLVAAIGGDDYVQSRLATTLGDDAVPTLARWAGTHQGPEASALKASICATPKGDTGWSGFNWSSYHAEQARIALCGPRG